MSKQKKRSNQSKKEPKANPYAYMSPRRRKLHENADRLSREFARVEKTVNRVLLAMFAVVVVLWIFKVMQGQVARYLIICLLGVSLGVNGISGYRQSRWAGFFLMVFGAFLFLGNLYMLAQVL